MRTFCFLVIFLFRTHYLLAQDTSHFRTTYISASYLQIKESLNYGLVFKGPELDFGMKWHRPYKNGFWYYEYKLGFSILSTREILAANLDIKPVDLGYLKWLNNSKCNIAIGPALKAEYNFQIYPDLQSGYLFWYTNYNVGISFAADLPILNNSMQIRLNNSVIGFISRTSKYEDPYFYNIEFADFIKYAHSDFNLTSFGSFNNTTFELRYKLKPKGRLALCYVFEYFGYYKIARMQVIRNSLRLIIYPKKYGDFR